MPCSTSYQITSTLSYDCYVTKNSFFYVESIVAPLAGCQGSGTSIIQQ